MFELDAGDAGSYPGEGAEWYSLTPAPVDGGESSDYSFGGGFGMAEINEPVFTGEYDTPGAYFATDGQKFFAISGGNTDFLDALHKSTGGTNFWMATVIRYPAGGNQGIAGTNARLTANVGVSFRSPSADDFIVGYTNGASVVTADSNSAIADGTDHAIVYTYNTSTRAWKAFNNSATPVTGTLGALTVTDAPTSRLALMSSGLAAGVPNDAAANGSRMYLYAMGNEYLTDEEGAAIIANLMGRFGIS